MNKPMIVSIALMFSCLTGQHYPFPHDITHSEENSSNCRAFAMANAYRGSYCPANRLGDYAQEIPEPDFIINKWTWADGKIEEGDLALWGDKGEDHVAYIEKIHYLSWGGIYVRQVPRPNSITGIQYLSIEEVKKYTDNAKGNYPSHYAKINKNHWKLEVKNEFWDGANGGTVGIDDVPKPSTYTGFYEWGYPVKLTPTMDNEDGDSFKHHFEKWINESENPPKYFTTKEYHIKLTSSKTNYYTAKYKRKFKVSFNNNFIGVSNNGYLTIRDTIRQLPYTIFIPEDESVVVASPLNSVTHNHIDYNFTEWSTGSEFHTITVTPTSDTTITAHYKGYPRSMAHYGISSGTVIGENISLNWNVHPNQNVSQYKIYREVKRKFGPWSQILLVGTVNRNTTSWEDPQYILTNGYSDDLLFYDVRPFYTIESTESKEDWTVTFGEEVESEEFFKQRENEKYSIPNQFSLSQNHPNPFNPTTIIKYEIPIFSSVSISIYDIRGNEVKTWVYSKEQPGHKQITWDATDTDGNKVPAGVYIYKLSAATSKKNQVFSKSMKMVLMK